MGDIIIFGMSGVLLVTLLVQGLKKLGLSDSAAPWAALVLSVLVAVAVQLLVSFPQWEPVIRTIVTGLVVFLMATGLYTVGKNVNEKLAGGG